MENIFTERDFKQIKEKGISIEKIEQQLFFYQNGIPKIELQKPAIIGDGILKIQSNEKNNYINIFDSQKQNFEIKKFVPASGAASRMFKFLQEFLNNFDSENETINAYINRTGNKELEVFSVGLKNFPFYQDLLSKTKEIYPNFSSLERDEKLLLFVKTLLDKNYLNFSEKPKGILPFHFKNNKVVTPVDEHLTETIFYQIPNKKSKVHFTISNEFQSDFEEIASNFNDVLVTYSNQKDYTDTLAVNLNNTPFRLDDGSLFFRPGGHGALIENLNLLQSDIIFIKNIDNVSQNHIVEIVENKKLLGGILIDYQNKIFNYLQELTKNEITCNCIEEVTAFVKEKMFQDLPHDFDKYKDDFKIEYLVKLLNRPIRICGMVKNEGEPGGGPFWVKDPNGQISLQIVESSQINIENPQQKEIFKNATHFNPVDIVCGIKNHKGEKFNLLDFVDHNSGFIVEKTKNGKPIKAFELPGLWNGAMALWNTIFVEVPLITFNPVKTVNDLLKPSHQPNNE